MKIPHYIKWIFDQPEKKLNEGEIIEEPTVSAKQCIRDVAILIGLGWLAFFFAAGKVALLGPDEPRYAEVAREMFASGDFISPRLAGCLWFEKPVLFYWLAASAYHLFGVDEFAARFPSALSALITVLMVYLTLCKTVSVKWARGASLVLLTCGIFIAYSRAATPDMLLTASMAGAILSVYLATRKTSHQEGPFLILGFSAIGLAFLAKGLVGILLVIAILFLYLLIAGRLRFFRWQYVALGIVAFLLVASTWYVPVTLKHGWHFIDEFFIRHHFQRYLSNVYGHPQPIYFFSFVAIAGIAPWTFFLIPAIARIGKLRPRINERDALLTLAWIWALVPLIFFSISESKLPGYLLPIFPALAIIIGAEVEHFLLKEQKLSLRLSVWLTAVLLITGGLGFMFYLQKQAVAFAGWQIGFYLLPFAFSLLAIGSLIRNHRQSFFNSLVSFVLGLVIVALTLLFPRLNDAISLKRLSVEAASVLRPDEKIGYYILKEFAAVFYAQGRVVCGIGEGDILNALKEDKLVEPLEAYESLIFITRDRWIDGLKNDGRFEVEFIAQQREFYAFRVRLKEKMP